MKIRKIKKRYWVLIFLLSLFISIIIALHDGKIGSNIGQNYSSLVLRNVNVISMVENQPPFLINQMVLIENGVIVRVDSDSGQKVNADLIIDANGKYLMPGLIDAHAHFFDVMDLPQTLSFGVTSVRIMSGLPMHLRWRNKILEGDIIGPNLVISTPALNSGDDIGPFHINVDKIDDISSGIKTYKDDGYDLIKIYSGLNEKQINKIFIAADANNIRVAGHLPEIKNINEFFKKRPNSIEHLEVISEVVFDNAPDSSNIAELSATLNKEEIVVVPTMVVTKNNVRAIKEGDKFITTYSKYVNPLIEKMFIDRRIKRLKNASNNLKEAFYRENVLNQEILKGLIENRVKIVSGTDSGPIYTVNGLSLLEELDIYVENGMSEYEALKSGTINAAKLLGLKKSGNVAEGYNAELLLLNKNPLNNINAIYDRNAVIFRNKYFNTEQLDELLTISLNKTGYYKTVVRLLEHFVK